MKEPFIKYSLLFLLPILIISILISILVINTDYSESIPQIRETKSINSFDLSKYISGLNESNILDKFPYKIYLDSSNYEEVVFIQRDLLKMDSIISNNKRLNRKVLSIALTQKLEEQLNSGFDKYNPDSLILMLQIVEKFKNYADLDKENAQLFKALYTHWLSFIANKLGAYYRNDNSVKYDYKFKYIVSRCEEKGFTTDVGNTQIEKAVNNVIEQNWCYLINRFWIGTTLIFKAIIFFVTIITLLGYCSICLLIIKKMKK